MINKNIRSWSLIQISELVYSPLDTTEQNTTTNTTSSKPVFLFVVMLNKIILNLQVHAWQSQSSEFSFKIRRIFSSEAEIQRVLDDGKGTCKLYVLFMRREIPRGVEFHMSVFFPVHVRMKTKNNSLNEMSLRYLFFHMLYSEVTGWTVKSYAFDPVELRYCMSYLQWWLVNHI